MQSMRRSRSVLVELMIAVLFLAIAACILARLFASAWETGEESRRTQASLILARDAIECFSAGEELPGEWRCSLDGQDYDISTDVTQTETHAGILNTCVVTVACEGVDYIALETTSYTTEAHQDENV